MSLGRLHKLPAAIVAAGVAFASTLVPSGDAAAAGPVSPTGKGIAGGALLGGEVVMITLGAAGVNRAWPYIVFTPLAAGGGAVGGYFLEKKTVGTTDNAGNVTGRTAEPALYMLAGGMALLIPALVLTLNATAYKPPETDRGDPSAADPARPAPKPTAHVPLSVVDLYKGKVALGLPALEVRPLYSQEELAQYRVTQGTEVRVPVFKAMF